ncbi:hypothetical protein STXM2123_4593 [Streptomyces sp. F-3]|nr:hypothetical protein STXM2123_4593 [Streptomyces sp. F-3]
MDVKVMANRVSEPAMCPAFPNGGFSVVMPVSLAARAYGDQ